MIEFAAEKRGSLKNAERFIRGFGGDTSNFAIAVARLGGQAAYLCRLAADDFGQALMDLWAREGVDTSRVIPTQNGYTAVYFTSWKEDGSHDFGYIRQGSAASMLSPADISERQFEGVAAFHTSGITQAISPSACDASFRAIDIARQQGVLVSYDPNLRLKLWPLGRARAVVMESVRRCDVFFPNIHEVRLLIGQEDVSAVIDHLLTAGPKIVALKLGEQGCLVGTADGTRIRVPAVRARAIDTSGAGDTFDAAFMVGLMSGWDVEKTARFAVTAAALTASGIGCVTPIPSYSRVLELMD